MIILYCVGKAVRIQALAMINQIKNNRRNKILIKDLSVVKLLDILIRSQSRSCVIEIEQAFGVFGLEAIKN